MPNQISVSSRLDYAKDYRKSVTSPNDFNRLNHVTKEAFSSAVGHESLKGINSSPLVASGNVPTTSQVTDAHKHKVGDLRDKLNRLRKDRAKHRRNIDTKIYSSHQETSTTRLIQRESKVVCTKTGEKNESEYDGKDSGPERNPKDLGVERNITVSAITSCGLQKPKASGSLGFLPDDHHIQDVQAEHSNELKHLQILVSVEPESCDKTRAKNKKICPSENPAETLQADDGHETRIISRNNGEGGVNFYSATLGVRERKPWRARSQINHDNFKDEKKWQYLQFRRGIQMVETTDFNKRKQEDKTQNANPTSYLSSKQNVDSNIRDNGAREPLKHRLCKAESHWKAKSDANHEAFRKEQKWGLLQSRRRHGIMRVCSDTTSVYNVVKPAIPTTEKRKPSQKRKTPDDDDISTLAPLSKRQRL